MGTTTTGIVGGASYGIKNVVLYKEKDNGGYHDKPIVLIPIRRLH